MFGWWRKKPIILLVMRLEDMSRVHPKMDNSQVCDRCQQQVGIYPSGEPKTSA